MIAYIIAILISMIVIIVCNIFITIPIFSFGVWYIIGGVCFSTIFEIAVDAIIAWIVHSFPKKCVNPFAKIYHVFKFEKKIYLKLGIKKWKDHIPESGKYLCNFAKDKLATTSDNEYIMKFMQETCYAELMHFISAILGFVVIFIYPLQYAFCFGFWIFIVNFVLQTLPIFVQRYNRPKLMAIYNRNLSSEKRNTNETVDCNK